MFLDNVSMKNSRDMEVMKFNTATKGTGNFRMVGESIDRIYKNGKLVEEIVGHNTVVNSLLSLTMCLLKHQEGHEGLQYWAVGEGSSVWDTTPATPDMEATRLTKEIGRVPLTVDCFSFLDNDYREIDEPSNILQIKRLFTEDECNGVWREFGIYGGNATDALNSGFMINKRHHGVITKTDEMQVERIMRFILTLV